MTSSDLPRLELFEPASGIKKAMYEALSEILAAQQEAAISDFMSTENILHYRHAANWSNPANSFSEPGEMEAHHAEYLIPHDRIINADMTLMTESIHAISEQMRRSFMERMYKTMSDACDKSGNVVQNKSLPDSFLEALERVEFSVNADGSVDVPQLHVGDPNFLEVLKQQPEEFMEKIGEIRKSKEEQALQRERERLAKYKRGDAP